MLATMLAIVGLSSCVGYTGAAKTSNPTSGGGVLSASSTSLTFGNVSVGTPATQSLSVTNTGTATVNISQATMTGAGFSVVGGNPSGAIAVGQSSTVQVQFAPTAAGAATGALTVISDASNSPLMISLSATGTQTSLTASPSTLNFANVTVGQSSTQSVRLQNTGSASVVINLATVAGNGFGIGGLTFPMTLTGGQSASLSVRFAPTTSGAATGNITFADNAAGSPQTVSLAGSGVASSSTLAASPASVTFGNVAVGSNGQQTITLTNTGNASATISAVGATGTGFTAFGLTTPMTLAANQSASFSAQFSPTTSGSATGSISVTSTASNSAMSIPVTGTGVQGALAANPSSVNFGNVLLGANGSVALTLTNSGTASVTVSQATASGTGFSMTGLSMPVTLAAGQSTSFAAKFAPTAAGSATGSISVVSTAPGSPMVIALRGAGTTGQAQLTMSPASVSYGNVAVGSSANQTITLTNAGNAALTITQVSPSGTGFSVGGVNLPLTINAGNSVPITAIFAPTTASATTGSISIVSNAPGSPAAIALSGTGIQGQLGANPATVNFGSVNVGSSGSQSITLTNSGSGSVTISQATASGNGFSMNGLSAPVTIAAGQQASFTVKYAPASAGSASGSVSIVSNAPSSPLVVSLAGSGTAAQPQLTISPASVSFGNVAAGSSGSQTVTLTNNGNATLTISQFSASGAPFTVTGVSLPITISAGSSASVTSVFTPTSAGAATGSISVVSNAPGGLSAIPLSGTGIQGQLGANPASVNFSSVAVGSSGTQSITITNSGSASVTISQASASGTGFSISGLNTPATIAAGQSAIMSAQFAPTTSGSKSGSISIVSNASNSPLTISLGGAATQPQITATPGSASFGNVTTGTSNSQTINLSNSGTAPLTISSVTVAGTGFNITGISAPLTIAAGSATTFNAVFAPTSAGAVSGSVMIASNAPTSPVTIGLSGTGVASTKLLGLSTSSLSFGNVNVGSNSTLNAVVTNNGNANVTISSMGSLGTGFSASGLTSNEVLTPNQSATVTVEFSPNSAGAVSGSVTIASDATNSPATLAVSGTGVAVTHNVTLTWSASVSAVIGYNVYRGTTSGGPYSTKLNSSLITALQYSDTTVASGQTYYYVVTAVNSSNIESADSNQTVAVIP
ncbi:MAG: choice-of-anchor D domain-containing protein [Candidatus Acidiferrales bacterium]